MFFSYASALMFLLKFSSNMSLSNLHFESRFFDVGQRDLVVGILFDCRIADHDVFSVVLFQPAYDDVQPSDRPGGLDPDQPSEDLLIIGFLVKLSSEPGRGNL